MGIFKRKTDESPTLSSLLAMDDSAIDKLLKDHKGTPFKNAKALRRASADGRRPVEGEKGMAALIAGMKGGGTDNKNWKNQPVSDRVHPSIHRRTLVKEVHEAIRSGDRQRQAALREEAKKHGYI